MGPNAESAVTGWWHGLEMDGSKMRNSLKLSFLKRSARLSAISGLLILLFGGFLTAGMAAQGDENDPLVKLVERQLDSIVRGTSEQIGVPLRDGAVIRAVRRNQRAIEIDIKLPIGRNDSVIEPSFHERRQKLQSELCAGETLKLILYGVSWVYGYSDKNSRFMQKITIDRCN